MQITNQSRLCIFDLDGTLVDSLRDIAEATNECLELLGVTPFELASYRYLVGDGIVRLAERSIGATFPYLVPRLIDLVRARYRLQPLLHTCPYGGVSDLVAALKANGKLLSVLSNKPHDMTDRITRAFWPAEFDRIQGYVGDQLRKPNPHLLLDICAQLGVAPANTCLVGDTPTDVETARRAGCQCIAITWGFRTRADLAEAGATCIVDTPQQVRQLLISN